MPSKTLLPIAIVALMAGSAPTLWASHHGEHDHDGDATVSAHDPNGGEMLVASHVERDDVSEVISAGDSHPVLPATSGSGDDQEDCGLVIREGDVPVFDNVPCIEPILLPRPGSFTLTR